MDDKYSISEISKKLDELLSKERNSLDDEEELEDHLGNTNLSDQEIIDVYENIISQVENEAVEFEEALELEEEEFQKAVDAARREIKLRREKIEAVLNLEEEIHQLRVTAENLMQDFSKQVFQEFLHRHDNIISNIENIETLEEYNEPKVNVEELTDMIKESNEVFNQLNILINHIEQETEFLSKSIQIDTEDASKVKKCRSKLNKISNSEHHIEELVDEIENLKDVESDQEKANKLYKAFKKNKSDLEELDSIITSEEFAMKAFTGVSTKKGRERVNKIDNIVITVSKMTELHMEVSNYFNQLAGEIATMDRRDYLKASGALASALAAGKAAEKYGQKTSKNIQSQKRQDQFGPLEIVDSRHPPSIRNAKEGERIRIEAIQLLFPKNERSNANYNWDQVEKKTKKSLKSLNVSAEINFSVYNLTKQGTGLRRDNVEVLKQAITNGNPLEEAQTDLEKFGVSETDKIVIDKVVVFDDPYDRIAEEERIKVIFSNFGESGGVSTSYGSETNEFVVMDSYGTQSRFTTTFVHEIGHKLGLPHTVLPQDVMSYSSLRKNVQNVLKGGVPHFSYESKYNWFRTKNSRTKDGN